MKGFLRRAFRLLVAHELGNSGLVSEKKGSRRLWGYGLTMVFPNMKIWGYQFLEIFGSDCYGISKLPEEPRIIDGGANIGTFSLYALWRRPKASIEAVEPSLENLHYFKENMARSGPHRILIHHAALAGVDGPSRLVGSTSDALRLVDAPGMEVRKMKLHDLLKERVDLLKLDIEGAEVDVLRSAGESLHKVDRIVCEIHDYLGQESQVPAVVECLGCAGFDRFTLCDHREFPLAQQDFPVHCSLLKAWRSREE